MGNQKFNYSYVYKQAFAVALIDKLRLSNLHSLSLPSRALVHIDLQSLEDFDSSRVLASTFILRLLTGKRPYIARFGLFQTFHEKDYDAFVQVSLVGSSLYQFLGLLAERVLPLIAKVDFSESCVVEDKGVVARFAISDLSFIRVVETHSIFFRWHDRIHVTLWFSNGDLPAAKLVLDLLRF